MNLSANFHAWTFNKFELSAPTVNKTCSNLLELFQFQNKGQMNFHNCSFVLFLSVDGSLTCHQISTCF